jgi:hypothetical protein
VGGVDAFNSLVFGGGTSAPERIMVDYSRMLSMMAPASQGVPSSEWAAMGTRVHEYFRVLGALSAIGERGHGEITINLTLANKRGKQLSEKVFDILGLKLRSTKDGVAIKSAEGKSEAKKQDALAALAIDDAGIQERLAAGKTFVLRIPIDSVPVFPSAEFWQRVLDDHEHYTGGLAEGLVTNARVARLFYSLNSMDRDTAKFLVRWVSVRNLEERYSSSLSLYSAALALNGTVADTPGGSRAAPAWQALTGVSPSNAAAFFESLLNKDEGRLIAFFYSLSQLDFQHQLFFTTSPERLKRFYDLFRGSAEMRRGGKYRIGGSGAFVEFLREIPLNDDLSVDFPGSAEVWMVAKGANASASSVAKMTRKMKRSVAPDSEDEILVRLATSEYNAQAGADSELANFIATVHIDAQRNEPLSPQAALLLAQGYSAYGGLYPYFTVLGDLDTADYQKLFALNDHFNGLDIATVNLRLGQVHSFLAMLGLLHESGSVPETDLLKVFRAGLERYLAATGSAAWTIASLSAMQDLARLGSPDVLSPDAAIQRVLLGRSASARRAKRFNQVLSLQKAPSLDALFALWSDVAKLSSNPSVVDDMQRQLLSFTVLPLPKSWRLQGSGKKCLESFDTARALSLVSKIREKQSKRKSNSSDLERLAGELTAELEPWTELAMVSRIYARYMDPTDLLVSEDPMLVRKHQFTALGPRAGKRPWFTASALEVSSVEAGSYFCGGLAEFAISAGQARAEGNHTGGRGEAFATAAFASIRATDWSSITEAALQSFGATVRLAREWIAESAISQPARHALEKETLGLLSLSRRHSLLDALDQHDWPAVWRSLTASDLYFLGQALIQDTGKSEKLQDFWTSPVVIAMRQSALSRKNLDELGSVAPSLNGCAQPRLRPYAPYEDYERYSQPTRMAQRASELNLYLALVADSKAWQPTFLEEVAAGAVEKVLSSIRTRGDNDWSAVIEGYEKLTADTLRALVNN